MFGPEAAHIEWGNCMYCKPIIFIENRKQLFMTFRTRQWENNEQNKNRNRTVKINVRQKK